MKRLILLSALAWFLQGALYGQNAFICVVEVSTATTIQAVGGDCAGEANISHFITGITVSSSSNSSTAADAMPTLKYGTGSTCATGTTIVWLGQTLANTAFSDKFDPPIRIPPTNDLCWIASEAGTKTWVIRGFDAP